MKKNYFQQTIATCLLLVLFVLASCTKEDTFDKQTDNFKLKSGATIVDVYCGSRFTLALKSDGTLWATGENVYGQLGTGDFIPQPNFVQVLTNVKAMSGGNYHAMVLKNDGTVWATGLNNYGQFGNGNKISTNSYIQVASNVKAIAAGDYHSMILTNNGVLKIAGRNNYGQLGTSDNTDRTTFTSVLTGVDKIAAGGFGSSYAKMGDCSLYATGFNLYGQLGTGDNTDRNTFTKVVNNNVHDVSASSLHAAVLMTNGSLKVTGFNQDGRLGTGDNIDRNSFVQVISSNVKSVCARGTGTFVSLYYPNNQLKCTGKNYYGNLGLGDNMDRNVFTVTVPGNVNKFSTHDVCSYYVKTDGTLWACGDGSWGGLGGISSTNIWTQIPL